MFDAIRNWFEVRAAMKDERRLRDSKSSMNSLIVIDKLKHVGEMLQASQRDYAIQGLEEMLARYPDEAGDLPETLGLLISVGRLDEAEALAVRGMQRNPDSRDFVRLYGEIADHRGDTAERLRRWRAFRRRYPAFGLSFRMEARALLAAAEDAAAEQVLADGMAIVTDDVNLAIDYAARAEARKDWPEALRRWAHLRDTFQDPIGWTRLAGILSDQGLYDQAEAELQAARKRFPLVPQIVQELAWLAERRGDQDGALAYWAELRRDLPYIIEGYSQGARLSRQRGDHAAADSLIIEGAGRAPNLSYLQYEFAKIAERHGDWTEALRRWTLARQHFPTDPIPYGHEAAALRALGRSAEAEDLLTAACEQFPDAADLHQQMATTAEASGQHALAARRWRAAVAAGPEMWWRHTALARALERSGDRAGADDALAAAITRLPDEPGLYAEYAVMAAQDGRADAAAVRWETARQRFGLHPTLAGAEAGWLRGQGRLAEAQAVLIAAAREAPDNPGLLHDLGHLAAQERDWPEAERCWRGILALQPQTGWAHAELARALREQGRADEAQTVLATAWELHPQDFGLGAAWAREASEARDWAEARRRWALLRERFPAEGHPTWQEAIALREAGRTQEACTLLLAGAERFPTDASFPHDLARLAEALGDHAQAELHWRRYTVLEPNAWWGWVGIASAVRAQGRIEEAEAVLLEGGEACPTIPAFLHLRAEWARQRQDWPEAERRATQLAARFPDAWEGIWGQSVAVREQGRLDESRALLTRGAERHPSINIFAHDLARVAEGRADWAEAERWWRAFLALDDNPPWAHGAFAHALYRQGRTKEADRHLLDAIGRHPNDIAFHQQYALAADHLGDLLLSRQRWSTVVERFPDDAKSLGHLAGAHAATGDTEEATRLLTAGLERFPAERSFIRSLMTIAADRSDEAAAGKWRARLVEILRHALEQQPDDPGLLIEFVHVMAALPQGDWPIPALQIERSLQAAIDRGNSDGVLHAAYAGIAAGRADWPEQYRRLQASVERFPNDGYLRTKLFAAREIMLAAAEHGPPDDHRAVAPDAAHPDLPPGELVLYFESLGGGGAHEEGWGFGCEFGYFQREYGQEPLSLLRWASIGPKYLIRALNEDFAGFGNPEAIRPADDSGDDWAVDDTVYHSRFDHTHLSRANVPREEAQRLVAMRMKFLARKLVGDLQAGEKIFVYRVIDRELTQAAIFRLAQAVNRFGRNIMLFVALADEHHPAFHVRHVHPGLMIGYIDFFRARGGQFREWNHDGWLRLCREALRVWQANTPESLELPEIPDEQDEAVPQMNASQSMEARVGWEAFKEAALQADQAGRPEEAEQHLRLGAERHPDIADFPHDLARRAEARGYHAEAEVYWRRYTALEPSAWWGWVGIASAVRAQGRIEDAETVLLEGHQACPSAPAFLHLGADWARQRQDWPEAERRAALLTAQFPEVWEGPWGHALAAREQGRLDDARTILLGGAVQYPGNIFFAHDLASLAKARADWAEAERWWRRYLELDDSQAWAHGELWAALEMQGRGAEADALLQAAIDRHRDEPAFHRQYAIAASHRGNPALALQRWEQVLERFPQDSHALRHLAGAYAANNETERAIRILESGLERSPEERDFARSLLEIALRRGETTAVARWRAHLVDMLRPALERQPDEPDLLVETFHTLKDLPQRDWPIPAPQIERSMQAAIERGNANGFLHAAYAAMAAARGDWAEQHRRLEASVRRFPTDSFLRTKMFEASEIILAQGEEDAPAIRSPSFAQRVAADMPAADVVLQFESLGGGGANEVGRAFGCEFGYFQREYGQEPLSLLRWASIGRSNLIRALQERFAGFGQAENIELNEEHGDD
jgi:tetratricopeptide (TPR) repeat protein